jgi:hypothetical protein
MWHAWERKVYKVFVTKSEGKKPLGRPRRRWENGIRMDLREVTSGRGGGGLSWRGIETGGGLL